jgi:hypothetical protein
MYCRKLPLYDTLIIKCKKEITNEDKVQIESILNELDLARTNQIVILLVHCYYLNNPNINPFTLENCSIKTTSRNSVNNLPYDIKIGPSGKGLSFDFDQLNLTTQLLLGAYCSCGV